MIRYYSDTKLNSSLREGIYPLVKKDNLDTKRLLPIYKTIFIHKIVGARGEDDKGVKNKWSVKNIRILEIAVVASERDFQTFLSGKKNERR